MMDIKNPMIAVVAVWALAGCASPQDTELPSADEVAAYYEYESDLTAEVVGNVASLTVGQDPQQLRRGGSLWAKVGPYVFLFTEETQRLFDDYPGVAAVRVTTVVGESHVATALLPRDALNDLTWRRALNIAGKARRDGTERVTLLEDLVEWGEAHTDFEYSSRFTRR